MSEKSLRDSLYLTDNPQETTFKYDNQLPSLPVPDIKQSVFKLLDTIKPIAEDEKTFEATRREALAFIGDPDVAELQEMLKERAKQNKNWLESWWLEFAYLRSRKPLIPYSNMSAPLPIMKYWPIVSPDQPGFEQVRSQRASLSIFFQLSFWKMLREEKMRPMIHKGVPWSMSQFKFLFNTVRQPGEPKDKLISWFRLEKDGPPESVEVIVLHKGYVFAIKPVTMFGPKNASILSAKQIEKQLNFIEDWCRYRPYGPGVGALTTRERSDWTEAREKLAQTCQENQRILERIEKALFVLILDDETPTSTEEILRLSMCGDPRNRWADKSISSIAFKNGTFGASADHTPYDGFCTAIMTHYLMTSVEECGGEWNQQLGEPVNSNYAKYEQPTLLEFKLDAQVSHMIEDARDQFAVLANTIEVSHNTFQHYGKDILKDCRLHPEAFVQCAIHAAYFKTHARMAPAYVTASTRKFYNGRTETCRSCYPEMHELAKALAEADAIRRPRETYALLRKSVDRFQVLMAEACNGQGCDRHLMGLYLTAMVGGKQVPRLFDDELVSKTNNYILSTSCSGYWNVCGGVPPLVEEGYGCFYGIEDHAITFCCTAYKNSAETDLKLFYNNLEQTLLDLQRVILSSKM